MSQHDAIHFLYLLYRAFGTEHIGVNFGLVITSFCVVCPVCVILPVLLHDIIGWNGQFIIMASLCAIGERSKLYSRNVSMKITLKN